MCGPMAEAGRAAAACGPLDTLALFESGIATLELVGEEEGLPCSLQVHAAVLRRAPFFAAWLERWDQGSRRLELRLPPHCALDACRVLLQRLYAAAQWPPEAWVHACRGLRDVAQAAADLAKMWLVDDVAAEAAAAAACLAGPAEAEALVEKVAALPKIGRAPPWLGVTPSERGGQDFSGFRIEAFARFGGVDDAVLAIEREELRSLVADTATGGRPNPDLTQHALAQWREQGRTEEVTEILTEVLGSGCYFTSPGCVYIQDYRCDSVRSVKSQPAYRWLWRNLMTHMHSVPKSLPSIVEAMAKAYELCQPQPGDGTRELVEAQFPGVLELAASLLGAGSLGAEEYLGVFMRLHKRGPPMSNAMALKALEHVVSAVGDDELSNEVQFKVLLQDEHIALMLLKEMVLRLSEVQQSVLSQVCARFPSWMLPGALQELPKAVA